MYIEYICAYAYAFHEAGLTGGLEISANPALSRNPMSTPK